MKRPFAEEYQIIIADFHEYLNLERRFNEYELARMSKTPRSYYRNLVCKFFAN